MKKLSYYLHVFISCIIISCSTEGVDVLAPIAQDEAPNTITTPCSFDLSDVKANSTITIDCLLDLNGETITLPANVSFEFGKGDIINGKLIFNGGTIAGELLSSKLEIDGDVQLKNTTFKFYAVRWNIVEGETTSDIAQKNNDELERLMDFTKGLGATTFQIGKFDAYFQVHYPTAPYNIVFHPSIEAVNVPSDFNLVMSDDTHLRIFPGIADNETGAILAVHNAENITIKGGIMHGDRDQRAYPPGDLAGQYGSHLLKIRSGRNITLDGIKFIDGSAGSLNINSIGFSYNPNTYNPTTNVTVKNCVFENSRRMSIALTEGRDIKILDNTFINTGNESTNSSGGEVGYAINIEATRRRDANENLKEFERAFDILIKGNTETGSRGGCVAVTIGQTVTIEDNNFETQLVLSHTNGTKVINNTFKALTPKAKERFAIFAADGGETAFNNEISGNTISGYDLGIATNADDTDITNNTITDCAVGLQIGKSKNSEFNDNKITTTGHAISATNSFVKNVSIKGNEINGGRFHIYFAQLNDKPEYADYRVTLENNTFITSKAISFSKANGVLFKNNTVIGGIQIGDASNIEISTNTVKPDESDGIRLYGDNTAISLVNNTIYEPTGASRYVCINNDSNNPDAITDTGNTCN